MLLAAQISADASVAYNESVALELRGPLDRAAMARGLQALVDRHDALRLRLAPAEHALVIDTARRFELPLLDFRAKSPEQIRQALLDQAETPFDLSVGPLFRAALLEVDAEQHLLVLTGHHTVVDGATMALLMDELALLYGGYRSGHRPELAPALSIVDFQAWLAQAETTPAWRAQKEFWLRRLSGVNPVLDMPLDYPRPPRKTYSGARRTRMMDAALYDSVRRVGQRVELHAVHDLAGGLYRAAAPVVRTKGIRDRCVLSRSIAAEW